MKVAGFDPGAHGAIAVYDTLLGTLQIRDMPTKIEIVARKKKRRIDAAQLSEIIKEFAPDRAIVEKVGARPGQGVSSMFAFGAATGIIKGSLAAHGVEYAELRPQSWHKIVRLRGGPEVKTNSRNKAKQIFPACAQQFARVKDDGRSDAALMAWAGTFYPGPYAR